MVTQIFIGRVDEVRDGTAYITFVDIEKRITCAEMSAEEMAKEGINVGDRFKMEIRNQNELVFTKIPFESPNQESMAGVDKLLDEALPDDIIV